MMYVVQCIKVFMYDVLLLMDNGQLIISQLLLLLASCVLLLVYGNFGYFLKSGLRFSKNAFPPSCASSVR